MPDLGKRLFILIARNTAGGNREAAQLTKVLQHIRKFGQHFVLQHILSAFQRGDMS